MSEDSIKNSTEALLHLPAAGLSERLSPALEEIDRSGIGKLLDESPDFMARLLNKIRDADPALIFSEAPDAADRLSALLWKGVAHRAKRSKEMGSLLKNAQRDFHGNIEASDSPFRNHFTMEKGKIGGGPGLLHFREEDFRFMGPTGVLIDMLTGDLPMGLGNLRLQTAGHPGWISRLVPVMQEINRILKGT
jgi:hypothetical protein